MIFCHAFDDIKTIPIRIQYGIGGDASDAAVTGTLNTLRADLLDPHVDVKRFLQEAQPGAVKKHLMLRLKVTRGSTALLKRAPCFGRPVNDDDPPGAGNGGFIIVGPSFHSPATLGDGYAFGGISRFNPAPNECHWSVEWKADSTEEDPDPDVFTAHGEFHVPAVAPGVTTIVSNELLKVEIARLNYRTGLDKLVRVKGEPDLPPPPGDHMRGEWSNEAVYLVGDGVTYLGKTYYCQLANTHKKPTDFPLIWERQNYQNRRGEVVCAIITEVSNGWFLWSPEAPYIQPYVTRFFSGPGAPRPDWRESGVDAETGPRDLWQNWVTPPGLSDLTRHGAGGWDNGETLTYGAPIFTPLADTGLGVLQVGYQTQTRVGAGPVGGGYVMTLEWVA